MTNGMRTRAARPQGGYRETLGELAGAQKTAARSAPAYSRFVNRRLGRLLAAWAYRAGLTPNAVTGISALFTFTGISLLALFPPSGLLGITVSACLVIGYAFDSADGQVARLRGGGSAAGEWLDHMVDALKVVSLPLALGIGFFRFDVVGPLWLAVPLASAVVSSVLFFGMILTEQLRRNSGVRSEAPPATTRHAWVRPLLVLPMDYGVLCLSFLLLGITPIFLTVYTLIVVATASFLVLASGKWFRDMRNLNISSPEGPPI